MYNSSWLLLSRHFRLLLACLHVLHNHMFQLIDLLYESLHQLVALLGCLQNLIISSSPTVPQTFFPIVFPNGISTTNRQVIGSTWLCILSLFGFGVLPLPKGRIGVAPSWSSSSPKSSLSSSCQRSMWIELLDDAMWEEDGEVW